MNEEPSGPIVLLNRRKTPEEAISKANSLPHGLAAYAFTNSARNAEGLVEGCEALRPLPLD
jgi:succinate-semialdehyde dehydrogenase/glutarate-semialdehyde dehydrogenase